MKHGWMVVVGSLAILVGCKEGGGGSGGSYVGGSYVGGSGGSYAYGGSGGSYYGGSGGSYVGGSGGSYAGGCWDCACGAGSVCAAICDSPDPGNLNFCTNGDTAGPMCNDCVVTNCGSDLANCY